jgi:nucleoside-diphosphate-sugar epimerase
MHILILGGTHFTGPYIVRELVEAGHKVTLFNRGRTEALLPLEVERIQGDRHFLDRYTGLFRKISPDVVIDMLAYTRQDAKMLMETFQGIAGRVVAASSIDVYRAYGRLHRTEPGPLEPVPLREDSPLREKLSIHGASYEKREVEEEILNSAHLAGTAVRLPAVYGPGDYRPYFYWKRMHDKRPFILIDENLARWRFSRIYVENAAHAIALAATSPQAAGKVYNVTDSTPAAQLDWVRAIAEAAGWDGSLITAPPEKLPSHLVSSENLEQDWLVDDSRIRQELGYREIVPAQEGIQRTIEWIKANPPEHEAMEHWLGRGKFNYKAENRVYKRLQG